MKKLSPIDLSKKLRPYENQWVALSTDHKEVLGAGKTLAEAKRKAQKRARDFIFTKLPPYDAYFVPFHT